jgi:hypothetical protein
MSRDAHERPVDELPIERRADPSAVERLEKGLWSAVLESAGVSPLHPVELARAGEAKVKEAVHPRLGAHAKFGKRRRTHPSARVAASSVGEAADNGRQVSGDRSALDSQGIRFRRSACSRGIGPAPLAGLILRV